MGEPADYLVSPVARVTAFCAGHEDSLLHFRREQSRPALRTKLQNEFADSDRSRANLSLIVMQRQHQGLLMMPSKNRQFSQNMGNPDWFWQTAPHLG